MSWIDIDNVSEIQFPQRIRYPEDEIDLNNTNYLEAVAKQGEDNMNTKLWWAIKFLSKKK